MSSLESFKKRKGLGIIHLNIRSLIQKDRMDHLKILAAQSDPDIIVLTETWLRHCTNDEDIALNNFILHRKDRVSMGGGVVIYTNVNLQANVLCAVSKEKCYEFLALQVSLGKNNSFVLIGIYRPPSAPHSAVEELADLLSKFSASELLVLGDFNLKWLSNASDHLKEICGNLNLTQLINEPTRPNLKEPTKSTLIDLILSNKADKITASGVFELGISDHCPIGCIRNSCTNKTGSRLVVRRNFNNFNEQAFLSDLAMSEIHLTLEISDVDGALNHFSKTFLTVVNKHAPFKKSRIRDRSSPWFTGEVSSLFKARNKAWSTARRSGERDHWLTFRQLRNKCTSAVRKAKSEYYCSLITSTRNPQNVWKIVNSLKNNSPPFPTSVLVDDQLISAQKEIGQVFNSHFAAAGHIFDKNSTNPLNKTDLSSTVSKTHGLFSLQPFFSIFSC
ncbi:hypothetical protein SRHO_G00106050 [Serrasalmus rhombeus]